MSRTEHNGHYVLKRVSRATPLILLVLGVVAAGAEVYIRIDQRTVIVWDRYVSQEFSRHTRFPSLIYFKSPVIIAGQKTRGNLTLTYDYMLGYGRLPSLHVLTFDQFSTWAVDGVLPSNPVYVSEAKRSDNTSNTSFRVEFEFEAFVSGVHYFVTFPDPVNTTLELFIRKEVPSALRQNWDNFRPYLGLFMVLLGVPGTILAIFESQRGESPKEN
jgi:hypothetical protein